MNKLKLYLLFIAAIFVSGCTNPNNPSLGTLQDEKKIQYKENEYAEILIQKDITANSEDEIRNKLKLITQGCVQKYSIIAAYTYNNERISSNSWFDISNDTITIESNVRNILKDKRDINSEAINLGGRYGNRMYKIDLPYKLSKVNENTYKITIYNNENIKTVESINNATSKVYEPTVYSYDVNKFKEKVAYIAKCI